MANRRSHPPPEPAGGYLADAYWEKTGAVYRHYPTIRHRRRFLRGEIRRILQGAGVAESSRQLRLFDYGCGDGQLLAHLAEALDLSAGMLAGSDISATAISTAKSRLAGGRFFVGELPEVAETFDVIVCSEVIEHTPEYAVILEWIRAHLEDDGVALITTQSGPIHASDRYTGHTQHFTRSELCSAVRAAGFRIESCRSWGLPWFTLQKYLTDLHFEGVRTGFLEGELSTLKRLVFDAAYLVFWMHDWIPSGPQLYLVARAEGSRPKP